jgi:Tfp pilus assembly protein PilZ
LALLSTQSTIEIFLKSGQDLRKFPRRISTKAVLFTAQNRYFAATTNNISKGGVFIETRNKFKKGQTITLVIARTKITKGVMLKGRVVHLRRHGFGLKFLSLLKNGKEYRLDL